MQKKQEHDPEKLCGQRDQKIKNKPLFEVTALSLANVDTPQMGHRNTWIPVVVFCGIAPASCSPPYYKQHNSH